MNTGHNWRFEAVGMGEPDRAEGEASGEAAQEDPREDARREIDRNERYRWTHYSLLQPDQANFELGYAVAASACVPTLFHPLPVTRLLQDPKGNPITVQLVDGGVHDNQGIEGLIEYDCNPIVVSDAPATCRTTAIPRPGSRPSEGGRWGSTATASARSSW